MIVALVALLVAAGSPSARTFEVEPSSSTVAYHVVHPFHRVTGTSSRIEGKALLHPGGEVLAMVRVPVASFDSGVANRDSNMRDALEASRFPFVVFKGRALLDPAVAASSGPTAVRVTMDGEVELHGVKRAVAVSLELRLSPDGTGSARGSFPVSLDAHGIERPSLLLVRIEDACRIDVELALREVAGSRVALTSPSGRAAAAPPLERPPRGAPPSP